MTRINRVVSSLTAAILCLLLLGGLPSAFAETFTTTESMTAVYEFTEDGVTRKEPSATAAYVQTYKKGARINIVAAGKNSAKEEWYKTSDGTYVKGSQIRLFYKQLAKMDEYWWCTKDALVAYQPFDTYETATYSKGTYVHVVAKVQNQSYTWLGIATTSYTWYKLDNGYFICGTQLEFRYKPVSCVTGTYEAINYNGKVVEFCTRPFTENNQGGTIPIGKQVTVIGAVQNSAGNTWYEIKETEGLRKWVWSNCFKKVSTDNITISGGSSGTTSGTPSGNLTKGKSFSLTGTINGTAKITSVTAGVYDSLTGKAVLGPVTVTPNATSLDINKSDINNKLKFANLAVGTYVYKVKATLSTGYSKEVINSMFNVVEASSYPAGPYNYTAEYEVIGSSGQYLRKEPKIVSGNIVKDMAKGTHFWADTSKKYNDGTYTWAPCRLSDGTVGWATLNNLNTPVTSAPSGSYDTEYVVVYSGGLKILNQYNKSSAAIKTMPKNTHFWVDMSTKLHAGIYDWAKSRMADGTVGWVAISNPDYCVPVNNTTTPPTTPPSTSTAQLTATASAMKSDGTFTVTLGIKNNPGEIKGMVISGAHGVSGVSVVKCEKASLIQNMVFLFDQNAPTESFAGVQTFSNDGDLLVYTFKSAAKSNVSITFTCIECKTTSGEITVSPKTVTVAKYSSRVPGDIDGDKDVDIDDVVLLLKKVSRWNVSVVEENCNVDGKGSVDIDDVVLLLKYVSKWNVVIY